MAGRLAGGPGGPGTAPRDRRRVARVLGWLYLLGPSSYALLALVLGGISGHGPVGVLSAAALGLLAGGWLLSGRSDLVSLRRLEAWLAAYTVLVCATAATAVIAGAPWFGFTYVLWICPAAFACLPIVRAAWQSAWAAGCCGVSLALLVASEQVGAWSAASCFGTVSATMVALAVLTGWLRTRESRRARQQTRLAEFGHLALSETRPEALLDAAARTALALVPGSAGLVLQLDPDGVRMTLAASHSLVDSTPPVGFSYDLVPGRPSWQMHETGEPVIIVDRFRDPRFSLAPPWDDRLVSAVAVPVPGRERLWGSIRVHSHTRMEYTLEDVAVLTGLAHLVAGALDRLRASEEMARAALHDALTGLPNRRLGMDRLSAVLTRRGGRAVALLLLDLDSFKDINDGFGHAAGDEVLRALATRLEGAVRPAEMVARLEGDEFLVIAEDAGDPSAATALADRVAEVFVEPFDIGGRRFYLSASIGVSLCPGPEPEQPASVPVRAAAGVSPLAARLLGEADAAMYRAKRRGPGRIELFDARMRAMSLARMGLENDLRRAMSSSEFTLDYQPVVDTATGAPVGVEALLRWRTQSRGAVPPAQFVPAAERLGLIVPLGAWALEEAAHTIASWQRAGLTGPDGAPFRLAVNLSPVQLEDPDLPLLVEKVILSSGLEAGSLGLEVTEGVLLDDVDRAAGALQALCEAGARILLDDFGTGHSSLSYLHRFPLQAVKLDQSFIARLGYDPAAHAIVGAVARMAGELGLEVIAEGVETVAQRAVVASLGVGRLQGFGIARPMPGPVTLDWLSAAASGT